MKNKIYRRKTIIVLFMVLFCTVLFSGCTAWDVIKDILSVNSADTGNDRGPKVSISEPTVEPKASDTPQPTNTPEPTPTEEEKEWVYCVSPVNVRAGAGNGEQILGALTAGQKVEKLGQERSWIKIVFEGREGWVYEKYMTDEKPVK